MSEKWTPGPWPYGPWRMINSFIVTVNSDGTIPLNAQVLAEFDTRKAPLDQEIANLIAAAPELYAAVEEALKLAKLAEKLTGCRGDDDYVWGLQEKFAAALKKARGE